MLNGSKSFFNRHLKTSSDSEILLNIFADEIHRSHQKFVSVRFVWGRAARASRARVCRLHRVHVQVLRPRADY